MAEQKFTRTITHVPNRSPAEQAIANGQCRVYGKRFHLLIVLSLPKDWSSWKSGLLKSLAPKQWLIELNFCATLLIIHNLCYQ